MRRFIFPYCLIVLTSCASISLVNDVPSARGEYLTASWYGPKFNGRPTASGERFDMYAMTCAHKTYRFGTKLRVTNPKNNKSVVVTVNDRGPFIRGRDLDLSFGAARAIGLIKKGVGKVRVEYLGRNMRYVKRIPFEPTRTSSKLTIQVASFSERSNATRLKKGLELRYKNVYMTRILYKGEKYYRVKVGEFSSYDNAYSVAKKLADEGYNILITSTN